MDEAHGCFYLIDVLSSGTGRAEELNLHVLRAHFNVYVSCLGKYRNRYGRCVNAAYFFGIGYALYAMHSRFIFKFLIHAITLNFGNNLFIPADIRLGGIYEIK